MAAEPLRLEVIRKVGVEKVVGFLRLGSKRTDGCRIADKSSPSTKQLALDLGRFCPFHGVVGNLEAGFRITPVPAEGDKSL